jgi:DNA-directed RNA polymerase subunit RPC12/RpoP
LRRLHRSFFGRFLYVAVYECRECGTPTRMPRRYASYFGRYARCPRCGTLLVVRRRTRDRIDGMHHGFLNFLAWMAGGKLTHCLYCRVQFYDRRAVAPKASAAGKQEPAPGPE